MEQLIELSPTEIKLAFVASCIEGTARRQILSRNIRSNEVRRDDSKLYFT